MPDDTDATIRKTITIPTDLWRRVEDWQHANRVKRDTEAFRQLVELGLKAPKK